MSMKSPEHEPRYRALLQLLRTSDTIWRASQTFFERWDLGPSQFNVLNLLHLNPGGLSQTDLSRFLVMHRSNLTGLVDRLEQRGLVRRQDATADRRAYRVVLTPDGTKLLAEILPGYYDGAQRLWDGLPARRVEQLQTDLARVAQNAERVAVAVNPPPSRKS